MTFFAPKTRSRTIRTAARRAALGRVGLAATAVVTVLVGAYGATRSLAALGPQQIALVEAPFAADAPVPATLQNVDAAKTRAESWKPAPGAVQLASFAPTGDLGAAFEAVQRRLGEGAAPAESDLSADMEADAADDEDAGGGVLVFEPSASPDDGAPLDEQVERVVMQERTPLLDALTAAGVHEADAQELLVGVRGHEDAPLEAGDSIELTYRSAPGDEQGVMNLRKMALVSKTLGRIEVEYVIDAAALASEADAPRSAEATQVEDAIEAAADAAIAAIGADVAAEAAPAPPRGYYAGVITASLHVDGRAAGLSGSQISQIASLLGHSVDFARDLRRGDRFEALYAGDSPPKGAQPGDLLYVSLVNRGKKHALYRGQTADGVGYYDEKGQSYRRALIRTPVAGARMTSGYGMRHHPILGYNKMHRGADFGARTGTPIIAAGDGVIDFIGWRGAYGRYIRIRHNGTYSTAYAHQSRFAKGIKRGSRVRQGDVIGYVGTSGRSTGPHLHFEVLKDGKQINPLKVADLGAPGLKGKDLKAFEAQRKQIVALLKEADAPTQVARSD